MKNCRRYEGRFGAKQSRQTWALHIASVKVLLLYILFYIYILSYIALVRNNERCVFGRSHFSVLMQKKKVLVFYMCTFKVPF